MPEKKEREIDVNYSAHNIELHKNALWILRNIIWSMNIFHSDCFIISANITSIIYQDCIMHRTYNFSS